MTETKAEAQTEDAGGDARLRPPPRNWLATASAPTTLVHAINPESNPSGTLERHRGRGWSAGPAIGPSSTPNSTNRSVVLMSIVLTMPTIPDHESQAHGQEEEHVELPHDPADSSC